MAGWLERNRKANRWLSRLEMEMLDASVSSSSVPNSSVSNSLSTYMLDWADASKSIRLAGWLERMLLDYLSILGWLAGWMAGWIYILLD
jgi:hypothetical protein